MIRITTRHRWTSIFLFVCCLSVSNASDISPATYSGPKEKLHVYAIAGMIDGKNEVLGENSEITQRCYIFGEGKKSWAPARLSQSGLACGFVTAMLKSDKDISIGLVFVDGPETRIEDWHRKSEYFRQLRGNLKAAESTGTVKGILWRHGVSIFNSALDNMKDLFAYVRADRGLNLPIVVGELPCNQAMNSQLAVLAPTVHALKVARINGLTTADGKKLKEGGLEALGERYAEQMIGIQKEWATKTKIRPRKETPCFDIHVHGSSNKENGLDIVSKWMEKNTVTGCLTLDLTPTRAVDEKQRQFMLANEAKYKGKILHCTYIEPDEVSTVEEAVKILEKAKADGAVGFGEHYGVGLMFDDPKILRLYAACEKVGLPVTFHIDTNKGMVEKGLRQVEHVLEMCPKCILIAHADWWLYLPDGTCDRMLQKHPNLYAETCAATVILNRDRGYAREFMIRNADKIVYGSDEGWWSFADAEHPSSFIQLCEELDLPEDVKEKVYRGNAEKLFGLKSK